MVGVGPEGKEDALARVSIVNYHGHVVFDVFVIPKERVTDWRTKYSGIRPSNVRNPHGIPFFILGLYQRNRLRLFKRK